MAGQGGEQPPEGAGGRKQRWPRRRVLRWALGLVPAVAGGGWAAFKWLSEREEGAGEEWPEDGWMAEAGLEKGKPAEEKMSDEAWAAKLTRDAAWFCFAGHPDASPMLDWAIRVAESYAPARIMSACWCMQEGRWDLVREDLSVPSVRETPEGRLLLELTERRPRTSTWRQAFFEAWQALGRPDFRKSTLLPEPLEVNHLLANTNFAWHGTDETRRLPLAVLNLALVDPHQEWVLAQVRASPSVPLLMALREQLCTLEARAPLRQLLLPVVEERLGQLAGPSPRTLQLALLSFLAGSSPSTPFEHRDLETLEKLIELKEWKQPSSEQFFLEVRGLFHESVLAPGHHALLLATFAQGMSLASTLLLRAKASQAHLNEDEQRWMGRLLWAVGARVREQPSHLELDTGLRLQMFGSELTGHSPTRVECIAAWVELGRWEKALAQAAYYRWPLAPLQEESCEPRARNEPQWMQAFAGKGNLP